MYLIEESSMNFGGVEFKDSNLLNYFINLRMKYLGFTIEATSVMLGMKSYRLESILKGNMDFSEQEIYFCKKKLGINI